MRAGAGGGRGVGRVRGGNAARGRQWEGVGRVGGGSAVLVGDWMNGVEPAKAAELPCCVVTYGYRDRPAEELGATILIARFEQLAAGLARIA